MDEKIKLNLACGDKKKEGFIGIDITETDSTDIIHDLNVYPWPFEDNSVDEIYCSHYIEHIPHDSTGTLLYKLLLEVSSFEELLSKVKELPEDFPSDGMIKFMNEVYRILKPKCKTTLVAPYYKSERAFGDPTHVRYIGDLSFPYYNKEWRDNNKLSHYGINCDFDMKYSYYIDNELTLKSEELRNVAFREDWNAINDITVELIKR